jgi:hypothetical protein
MAANQPRWRVRRAARVAGGAAAAGAADDEPTDEIREERARILEFEPF